MSPQGKQSGQWMYRGKEEKEELGLLARVDFDKISLYLM